MHEPVNESVNENGINEILGKLFKECYDVFLIDLLSLSSDENIFEWYHLEPFQGMVKELKTNKLFSWALHLKTFHIYISACSSIAYLNIWLEFYSGIKRIGNC